MDIVSRLKTFINYLGTPVTQFADSCAIPRPTLSQLLNGRNKKVSDELIGKIHDTFPDLSVLWLMFGEGDMLHNKNIEISEPQNNSIFGYPQQQTLEKEPTTQSIDFDHEFTADSPNKFSNHMTPSESRNASGATLDFGKETTSESNSNKTTQISPARISFNSDESKKIVNIIIYYSDNSFESFIPNK